MMRPLALLAALVLSLTPSALRALPHRPDPRARCAPEGRGTVPAEWVGCATDPGPPRALSGRERVLLGLRVDLNQAGPDDLAAVPGLSPRLGAEIAADRARRGPFGSVAELLRVRGIGPGRLARARASLDVGGR